MSHETLSNGLTFEQFLDLAVYRENIFPSERDWIDSIIGPKLAIELDEFERFNRIVDEAYSSIDSDLNDLGELYYEVGYGYS